MSIDPVAIDLGCLPIALFTRVSQPVGWAPKPRKKPFATADIRKEDRLLCSLPAKDLT